MKSLLVLRICQAVSAASMVVACGEPGPSAHEPEDTGFKPSSPVTLSPVQSTPLAPRVKVEGSLFQSVPISHSGLEFRHQWQPETPAARDLMGTAFAGGAVALGDIDGDGLAEIFLTRPHGGSRLYKNLGNLQFTDITTEAGLEASLEGRWSSGATFVDVQGDGYLDLYVCGYDCPNRFFLNDGNGRFSERAIDLGLAFSGASVMMSFADYDRDGDLDGHLLTNRLAGGKRPEGAQFVMVDGRPTAPEALRDEVGAILKPDGNLYPVDAGQADRLYRNDGGRFTEVSEEAGLRGHFQGLSATWWDYNGDGWADLYVANDFFGPDHLYQNNKDGTFSDVIADTVPHTPWFSMGSDTGDLDNDGRLDLIVADMAATTHYKQKVNMGDMDAEGWFLETATPRQYMRNAVYLNTGTPRFLEVAYLSGMAATDWTWAVKIADFDCDGLNDVLFTNGMTRPFFHADVRTEVRRIAQQTGENRWIDYPPLRERNRLFRNLGRVTFEDVSEAWGMTRETVSFGAASGDLDGDGDLDLVVSHFEEPVELFHNTSSNGQLLKVILRGRGANRNAIGAEVRLRTLAGEQTRLLQPVRGFFGCDPAEMVFGLGEASKAESLVIRWPTGDEQSLTNLTSGHSYVVRQPESLPAIDAPPRPKPLFEEVRLPHAPTHVENPFDDFAQQPLLPNRLSTMGPAMAWADLDQNGRIDCFLGGASGFPGQLWLQSGEGKWYRQRIPFFVEDAGFEDVAATFFDAEGDGDMDLFVVSGGVESETFRHRLYLSVEGGLTRAPETALPDRSFGGSCVTVGDVDGDDDADLFVGARVVPGRYPTSPPSQILINDGSGHFTEGASEAMASLGMVTDGCFSDVDGDADLDLIVTTEYGPVRCLSNEAGVFREIDAGMSKQSGWWTCVAPADVDGDGDVDFAVGNFGWNTKYHPSPGQPQYLYYGDFEGRGEAYCVEAHPDGGSMVPNRGLSCSSAAMGFLRDKFSSFHAFAVADLTDIYGGTRLNEALRLEANTLASGVLVNDGTGHFSFQPLPRMTQVAPCLGLAFMDADGDGRIDLYVSQNFFGPQRETGRMAGGLGQLLLGQGDATFQEVPPLESGVVVAEDARRAMAVDLDADGHEDLVMAINNGAIRTFRSLRP